jgi:hypothetical protein
MESTTATRPPLISTHEPTSSRRHPCPHLEQPRPPQPHGSHVGAHELEQRAQEHAGSHSSSQESLHCGAHGSQQLSRLGRHAAASNADVKSHAKRAGTDISAVTARV